MALSLKESISKVKEIYPDMYPIYYVPYKDMYLFSLAPRGVDRSEANIEFRLFDPKDGGASGSIPLGVVLKDKELMKLLKNPYKIHPEDQKIEHGISVTSNYYNVKRTTEYLMHYGIPGQSWGKKNGPPYPLDAETHKQVVSSQGIDKNKVGELDPELIAVAVEATAVAAFIIGCKIYAPIRKNKNHKKYKEQNDQISEDYLSDITSKQQFTADEPPKKIKGDHTRESDMAAVNPKFDLAVKGNSSNCALCSLTYDLRRRGYDVTAKLCETGMYGDKLVQDLYEGVGKKLDDIGGKNWSEVYRKCESKYPEGSRGMITVSSIFGGHAMAFEIQDGKMEIYDAQCNTKRKLTDEELSFFQPSATQAIRLDDKEVKWENAGIVCAELKPDWKKTIKAAKDKNKTSTEDTKKSNKKVAAGVRSQANLRLIREYKKEHPGTKLSDKEILNTLMG